MEETAIERVSREIADLDNNIALLKEQRNALLAERTKIKSDALYAERGFHIGDKLLITPAVENDLLNRDGWTSYQLSQWLCGTVVFVDGIAGDVSLWVVTDQHGVTAFPDELVKEMRAAYIAKFGEE